MSKARDVIAREIEPQAWTAHGVPGKDSIAYGNRRKSSERKAYRIINALHAAGYRILGPDEVDQVTVEKAAKLVEEGREVRDPLDNYESTIMVDWEDMDKLAAAIRALGRKA